MAFLSGLKEQLKSRKRYVEETSEVATGAGEGVFVSSAKAPGKSVYMNMKEFKDKSDSGFVGLVSARPLSYLLSFVLCSSGF